jgi:amino acid adenylation domain-containing protein
VSPGRSPEPFDGALPTVWHEPVAAASIGAAADAVRVRETTRDLAGPLRIVLLEYQDGVRELVVSGQPAVIDRAGLDRVAELVLCGHIGDVGAPPLPSAAAVGAKPRHSHRFRLPSAARRPSGHDLALAAGLACARLAGLAAVALEITDDRGTRVVPLDVTGTVAANRAALCATPATPADAADVAVHVAVTLDPHPPAANLLDYRPPADSRHPLAVYVAEGADDALVVDCWGHEPVTGYAPDVARIAWQLAELPDQALLADVSWCDDRERQRVVALGATARVDPSLPRCVHDLVRASMVAHPDAVALIDADHQAVTYRELVEGAMQLAHALRELGVATGDRVGVCLNRSADLVTVLLATLAAGATYVPLDPEYPRDRLSFLAQDAGMSLVVIEDEAGPGFERTTTVTMSRLATLACSAPTAPPETGVTPDHAAYVIYTSGSTGQPKGVVVPHRNVARLLSATTGFRFTRADTWTWFHSVAFDFSVWEIWGCLITGGRLVVVPRWVSRSPEDFRGLLARNKVTVLNQTPSAFAQLLDVDRKMACDLGVRLVIFGGEPLDARLMRSWFDRYPESECQVVNMFGITETTVHVTRHTVTRADALVGSKSVGTPIPGWSVRVVDERGRLLPPGYVGEIAVGGDGLAHGYLDRPDLTSARFVRDPVDGERLYLSGDKGRLRPDGQLEHLGRIDNQVTLRGHRIEPEEIRSVLLADPTVVAAAVRFSQHDPDDPATARVDGYVVLNGGDAESVRRLAGRRLPDYMMPSAVLALPALPLTDNGKLDVDRLPAPQRAAQVAVPTDGDATALDVVVAVWSAVFGRAVLPSDDFFTLGGNSLLAVRIARALRDHGLRVDTRSMYRHPSPVRLAAALDAEDGE